MLYKTAEEFAKNYEICDAHAHIFPEKIARKATQAIGKFYGLAMHDGAGVSAALLKSGGQIGVSRYLVCSAATTAEQVESINHFIAAECEKHAEFVGFGTLHPDFDRLEEQVQFCLDHGLRGIKLHPDFQQFNIDDEKAYKIYALVAGKLPILFHTGDHRYTYSAPTRLKRVAADFPNLICLASHFGGWQRWDEAAEQLAGLPNVYFDCCSSLAFMTVARARQCISVLGEDRIFFGCDFPMWDHKEELERFMRLNLTEAQNRSVLSENFKRVFRL